MVGMSRRTIGLRLEVSGMGGGHHGQRRFLRRDELRQSGGGTSWIESVHFRLAVVGLDYVWMNFVAFEFHSEEESYAGEGFVRPTLVTVQDGSSCSLQSRRFQTWFERRAIGLSICQWHWVSQFYYFTLR